MKPAVNSVTWVNYEGTLYMFSLVEENGQTRQFKKKKNKRGASLKEAA